MMNMCSGEHTERTGSAGRTVEPEGRKGDRSRTPRDPHTGTPGRHTSEPGPAPQLQNGGGPQRWRQQKEGSPPPEPPKSPREAQPGGAPPDPTREEPNGGVSRVARSPRPSFQLQPRHPTSISCGRSGMPQDPARARQRGTPQLRRSGTTAPNADGPRRAIATGEGSAPATGDRPTTSDRPAGRSSAGPNQVRSRPAADPGSCGPPD